MALVDLLHMRTVSADEGHVEVAMPITSEVLQPFGFLHGGATISLLETAASIGAETLTDLDRERPFGIDVRIRHRKSGKAGTLRGFADLDRVEGNRQYWHVVALDDEDDVVSEGTVVTKIVSLERLAQRERERTAAREAGASAGPSDG